MPEGITTEDGSAVPRREVRDFEPFTTPTAAWAGSSGRRGLQAAAELKWETETLCAD